MKITNFFIDFVVIGVIAGFCIILPIWMFNPTFCGQIITNAKDKIYLTPVATIVTYILGIIFNQISDQVIKKVSFLPILKDIRQERDTFTDLEKSDHDCLQSIVYKSPSAYEYLSYRRSIIRITKALIMFSAIIIIVHPLNSLVAAVYVDMGWSIENTVILVLLTMLLIIKTITLRKVEVGYFKAIKSFYNIISEQENRNR